MLYYFRLNFVFLVFLIFAEEMTYILENSVPVLYKFVCSLVG